MKVDSYSFGNIKIDGKTFTDDVIVTSEKVLEDSWWRKEGHELNLQDMKKVFNYNPDIFIMGIGHNGRVDIQPQVKNSLKEEGIELKSAKTTKAVDLFNRLADQGKKVAAGFHLTC